MSVHKNVASLICSKIPYSREHKLFWISTPEGSVYSQGTCSYGSTDRGELMDGVNYIYIRYVNICKTCRYKCCTCNHCLLFDGYHRACLARTQFILFCLNTSLSQGNGSVLDLRRCVIASLAGADSCTPYAVYFDDHKMCAVDLTASIGRPWRIMLA